MWWKSYFDDGIAALPGVTKGFAKGLDLMNSAMALGDDAKYRSMIWSAVNQLSSCNLCFRLKRPDMTVSASSSNMAPSRIAKAPAAKVDVPDVSFRSLVEDFAAENNLIFLPTGKSHATTGQLLFRVSRDIDGKAGITVYLHDDIVWVQGAGDSWSPIGLQDMVKRAT